jgi:hypothetical protein
LAKEALRLQSSELKPRYESRTGLEPNGSNEAAILECEGALALKYQAVKFGDDTHPIRQVKGSWLVNSTGVLW